MSVDLADFVGISPVLSYWRGIFTLKDVQVSVQHTTLEEEVATRPSARCLSERFPTREDGTPWLGLLRGLERDLARVRERYSVNYRSPLRIVPRLKLDAMLDELRNGGNSIQARIERYGYEFADDWSRIRAEILRQFPYSVQELLEKQLPRNAATVRSKFGLSTLLLPLSSDYEQFAASDATRTTLERLSELSRARTEALIETLVGEPRDEVLQALSVLIEQAQRDPKGRVGRASLGMLSEKIDKLRTFASGVGGELHARLQEAEETIAALGSEADRRRIQTTESFRTAAALLAAELRSEDSRETAAEVFAPMLNRRRRVVLT